MKAANPYLNFPGNTEEAFTHYRSIFGGEFSALMRYRDFGENTMGVSDEELDKIAHISLPLGGSTLMGTDVVSTWPAPTMGTNFYITIEPDSLEEAERLFAALSDGGQIEMELQQTSWAERHGSCTDRFGIRWMVDYTGNVQFTGG
jgi:PhnB protein